MLVLASRFWAEAMSGYRWGQQGKEINFTEDGDLLLLGVSQDAQIFTYKMASQRGLEHCFKVGRTFFKSHCFFLGKGLLPKAPLDTMLSTLTKTQNNQHKPPHLKGEGAARCEQAQDQKARAIFFWGGICLSLRLQVAHSHKMVAMCSFNHNQWGKGVAFQTS